MKKEVSLEFAESLSRFVATLDNFSEEKLNEKIAVPGSWTAAQVADHVLKSLEGIPELLNGKTADNFRDPEEKRQAISDVFLDFNNKMQSPDFILPSNDVQDKAELVHRVAIITEKIAQAISTKDLKKIYNSFELPGFGTFSGLEWLWFATCHTERHHQQLLKISRFQSGLK